MTDSTSSHRRVYWISAGILLALWETAARALGREIIIPSLFSVGRELLVILGDPGSWKVILATLGRIALTLAVDLTLALTLGIPAGLHPALESALRPMESAVRSVPTMGIILLALIWLRSGTVPIFVTSLVLFPILYRSTLEGIRNIDPLLAEFHRVHRVPFKKRLIHFYIPSLSPFIRGGARSALGLGFKVMITAEVLAQPEHAVGTVFQIERSRFNTAGVAAWCVFVIGISSLFDLLLSRMTSEGRP